MASVHIDPMLLADVAATCNNLGYYDEAQNKYLREPECLECVKELIRFLRRDDENHEIRRALGETKVLVKDLLPIVKFHADDRELFDVTLRLLVNLTTPVQVLYEEEVPGDRIARCYYLELVQCLQTYKEAFADHVFWSSVAKQLTEALGKEWEDRMEDDRLSVERMLILLRNVLHVPADRGREQRTDDDASVHDQVLWAIHLASIEDLLLFVAQSSEETHLCMHVLEVVSLMLREQNGKQLARTGSGGAGVSAERERDTRQLEAVRQRELAARQASARKVALTRHTRFGGTYRVQNMSSISERDMIYHKPLAQLNDIKFDKNKTDRKTPRNRMPLKEEMGTRRSLLSIRLFLKQFCVEFLVAVYNKLMYDVKDHLARAKGQLHDETYYMWALKFFMEFNRNHQFRIAYVSETLSVSVFHYLQTQMELYLESMTMEKNKIRVWSRRLSLALRAYQELLFTIQQMVASGQTALQQSAHVLQSNLFYMPEYRELVLTLLCRYDPVKMSRQFLSDLVQTVHVFLKLLEKFSGGARVLVKQKRAVKRRAPRKKTGGGGDAASVAQAENEPIDVAGVWHSLSGQLSELVADGGQLAVDVAAARPFDAASDTPIDQQRADALFRIQEFLHTSRCQEAVALLRASREVWPDGDVFGAADITPEQELAALREIHHCKLPDRVKSVKSISTTSAENAVLSSGDGANKENTTNGDQKHEDREEQELDEEEEEIVDIADGREKEFDFPAFVRKFCSAKVVEVYCSLLGSFDTNSPEANHCLLKLLYRVACTNKMAAMLFQASLFRTFHRLMDNDVFYRDPRYKDLVALAKYVLRRFFTVAATSHLVFVEMLFWKNEREAYELEHGYDSYRQQNTKTAKLTWSEEEEDELSRLYDEFKDVQSTGERDVVDCILDNLISRDRSRRSVIKKLKQLDLVSDTRALKSRSKGGTGGRASRHWGEEEVQQLHVLWQEHKDGPDPLTMIRELLPSRRPKNRIGDKLLELGLAAERRELFKKRRSRVNNNNNNNNNNKKKGLATGDDSDDSDDVRRGSGGSDSSTDSDSDSVAGTPTRSHSAAGGSSRKVIGQRSGQPASVQLVTAAVHQYLAETDVGVSRELITWLTDSLDEAVVLRRTDPDEDTALVPLTESCATAAETSAAKALMTTLGALPPSDQEMFWRWPASLSISAVERNAKLLSECVEGKHQNNSGAADGLTLSHTDATTGVITAQGAIQSQTDSHRGGDGRGGRAAVARAVTLSDADADSLLAALEQDSAPLTVIGHAAEPHLHNNNSNNSNSSGDGSSNSSSSDGDGGGGGGGGGKRVQTSGDSEDSDVDDRLSRNTGRHKRPRRTVVLSDDDDNNNNINNNIDDDDEGGAVGVERVASEATTAAAAGRQRQRVSRLVVSSDSE